MKPTAAGRLSRIVFNFGYYKLAALAVSIVVSYELFARWGGAEAIHAFAGEYLHVGALLAGMLYAFGFTSPLAAGVFLSMSPVENPLRIAVIGGLGALAADFLILKFVKISFRDEFQRLKKQGAVKAASQAFEKSVPEKAREYFSIALAGVFIASPLPDEIGVSLLAGFADVDETRFAIVSFLLNAAGILILLLL